VILDTNGLSAVADGDAALEPILRKAAEVAVPVIVLGEYQYGIQQSRNRQRYEQWLTESIRNYRVLDVDEDTARSYATFRPELKHPELQFLPTTFGLRRFAVSILPPLKPRPPFRSCGRNRADRLVTLSPTTGAAFQACGS
jgi:predicted nucleic acid-binding protein